MSYTKYFILYILITVAITGCETNIDYEGDPIENLIVLNSLVNADSTIKCRISRSNTILEPNIIQGISNATVRLYKNGVFVEDLINSGLGNYHSKEETKAVVSNEYSITIEHPHYKSVNATTQIEEKPMVTIKSIKESNNDTNSRGLSCELEIADPVGEDFYRIKIYAPKMEYDYETGNYNLEQPYSYNFIYINSKDPVLNNNTVYSNDDSYNDMPPNEYQVFDDRLFDGEKHNLTFFLPAYGFVRTNDKELKNKFLSALRFEVQRISKDVYKYFTTIEASKYYEGSPFSEPIKVHSNVIQGAGIFGGVASSVLYYEP